MNISQFNDSVIDSLEDRSTVRMERVIREGLFPPTLRHFVGKGIRIGASLAGAYLAGETMYLSSTPSSPDVFRVGVVSGGIMLASVAGGFSYAMQERSRMLNNLRDGVYY